jgi:hypothetical protein
MFLVIGILAYTSMFLGKLCLLFLYQRIFGHISKVRYQIYIAYFMTLPIFAGIIVLPVLSAPPPGKPWGTPNPRREDNGKFSLGTGVVNLLVDLFILYIPIPVIASMNLSRRKKTGVLVIFLTGLM